jgi:hypothetical protein
MLSHRELNTKKRRNQNFGMHKAGDKNPKRVAAREEKGREDTEEAERMLTILTDPFDNMDWATKKHLGLFFYFTHLKDNSMWDSLQYASTMAHVDFHTILRWAKEFKTSESIGNKAEIRHDL